MKTVNEVYKMTGVSVRTLHYYDEIGLLPPSSVTDSGYRLYDDIALEKLQQILLFRELEFPLKDIVHIVGDPSFDKDKALKQQVELLTLKKKHIEELIAFAKRLQKKGDKAMSFEAFDKKKIEEYKERAKASWGNTAEYKEFEQKSKSVSEGKMVSVGNDMMKLFVEFGTMLKLEPSDPKVQSQVKKLQAFITDNYYTCSDEMLGNLGKMYNGGNEFTANINAAGGDGCAEFVSKAIEIYCK